MTGLGIQQSALRRVGTFAGICLLHVLFLWAFINGLANRIVSAVVTPFETTILAPKPPRAPAVPALRVSLRAALAIQVVPPAVRIASVVPASPSSGATGPAPRSGSGQGERRSVAAPEAAVFLSAPNSDDLYPALAQDLGEHGVVLLQVCIDAAARVQRVEVLHSSHYKRLDDAAVLIGQQSRWKSATRDGRPVSDCNVFRVEFIHAQR